MKVSILMLSCFLSFSALAKDISIMNYNVENLFDTIHDEGKDDYTYLPLSLKNNSPTIQAYCNSLENESYKDSCLYTDWREDILEAKIRNIGKVISTYNNGKGADIVVMEEVENKRVLTQLVDSGLKDKGYKYISLIEGPDSRGIDVGIISKYPIVSEKLHIVDLSGISKDTRGILEVKIKVGSKTITVFGNHWPSQSNPSAARVKASEVLIENALLTDTDVVIATGDFNTLENESPNAITNLGSNFMNIEEQASMRSFKNLWFGSHWYKGEWTALDKIFVLRNFKNVKLKFRSFNFLSYKFLLTDKKWTDYNTGEITFYKHVPFRFDLKTKTGYSDHLPIVFKIKL